MPFCRQKSMTAGTSTSWSALMNFIQHFRPDAFYLAQFAGAAARTAAGEPNRSKSAMRVRGPTPEINDRRSMSSRS